MTPPVTDAWTGAERIVDESACPVCGRESCEGCTDDRPGPEDARPRHRFQCAADVLAAPAPVSIVEGILYQSQITVLPGESTAGKTFVALDLSAAISNALPHWFGRGVEAGSAAFCSFEGDALGRRLEALVVEKHRVLDHLHILRADEPLSPLVDRDRLELPSRGEMALRADLQGLRDELAARGAPPIRLLVVDTLRASLSGSEDSSDNISAYLRVLRRLLTEVPTAAGLITHHTGWQDGDQRKRRERGSSSIRGNVDVTVYIEADSLPQGGARLVLHTLKCRDDATAPPLRLLRRVVTLPGLDARGRPRTSCVIDWDARSHEDVEREAQAEQTARYRADDHKVLRVILEHPDATAQRTIRAYAGLSDPAVRDALSRILAAGWATPPSRQRQPYTLTAAGLAALREAPSCE